jgi:hypothetical protein
VISSIPDGSAANCHYTGSSNTDDQAPCEIGRIDYSPDGTRIVAERYDPATHASRLAGVTSVETEDSRGLCYSRHYRARASRTCLTEPPAASVSGSGYARSTSSTKGIHVSA